MKIPSAKRLAKAEKRLVRELVAAGRRALG